MVLKMSIIYHVVTLVALLICLQCKVHAETIENEADIVESMESASRAERSVYPKNTFLAGEQTPVWLFHENENGKMVYDRLEAGIVKKAIDYFRSSKFHGLPRSRRNIGENINLIEESQLIPHVKRDADEQEKFYYPSLLVVMEYDTNWPSKKEDQDKVIFEKILYALTYWNEVDIQLRAIRHPGVRIRIAGIAIGRDKDVTPVTTKRQTVFGIRLYDSLGDALMYWQKLRKTSPDFREGTFNVVATMTDTGTLIGTGHGSSIASPVCGVYPLNDIQTLDKLTGLIVHDNQDFGDIGHAVAEMSHIMGRRATGAGASVDARSFSKKDLQDIKAGLRWASCWKTPNEVHNPGEPVEALQREDVMPH